MKVTAGRSHGDASVQLCAGTACSSSIRLHSATQSPVCRGSRCSEKHSDHGWMVGCHRGAPHLVAVWLVESIKSLPGRPTGTVLRLRQAIGRRLLYLGHTSTSRASKVAPAVIWHPGVSASLTSQQEVLRGSKRCSRNLGRNLSRKMHLSRKHTPLACQGSLISCMISASHHELSGHPKWSCNVIAGMLQPSQLVLI